MGAKTIVALIALWTGIQGCAYGVLSILALLAHGCRISMRQNRITYLMYIIFFRDRKCEPIEWRIVADVLPPFEPTWPAVTTVAFRTSIFALIYLILSMLWIITSLMLIVACFVSNRKRSTFWSMVFPWVLLCALTCIFDVIATGFFFYDLFRTLNMESFLEHLEMRNTATIFQGLVISAEILPLPAVIMLGVASRGLLFWCLNLLCIPLVISMSRRFLFGSKQKSTSSDDIIFEASQTESPVSLENHFPPMNERSRYSDPSYYHQYQYDNINYQKDQSELGPSIGRRYTEPLKDKSDEPSNGKRIKRDKKGRQSSGEEKSSKKSTASDNSQNSISTMHLSNIGAHDKSAKLVEGERRPSWLDMTSEELRIERPHFRLPNKPSLLKKLSDSSYVEPTEETVASAPHAGDILRNQMPWSYFHGRQDSNDAAASTSAMRRSKQTFAGLREDEDTPPVPVPDYTIKARKDRNLLMHSERRGTPPKKFINPQRSTQPRRESNNNHESWEGPEFRY